MGNRFLEYGLWYIRSWGVAVVPASPKTGAPLARWGVYAESGMSVEEWLRLYRDARSRWPSGFRVAVVTGHYQARDAVTIVDVDQLPEGVDREAAARHLARLGYPVALTPRGLHVYARVEPAPHVLVVRGERGERLGEGAGSTLA